MIFIVNGEHTDITDRVSETEPYIYRYTDEEGIVHYWIVGKNGPEPEHYGFAEYLQPADGDWTAYGFAEYLQPIGGDWTAGYVARTDNNEAPWLHRAWDELGFDFQPEAS